MLNTVSAVERATVDLLIMHKVILHISHNAWVWVGTIVLRAPSAGSDLDLVVALLWFRLTGRSGVMITSIHKVRDTWDVKGESSW